MFNSIRLVNFKSFSDIIFDFTQKNNNHPKNLVSIYGENGSGKTNIVDSFKILKFSTLTTSFAGQYTDFQTVIGNKDHEPNGIELFANIKDVVLAINYRDIKSVLKNSPRINASANTKLEYNFVIDRISGTYSIEYDNKCNLISESLYYMLNKRRGMLFDIKKEETNIQIYLNNITFKLNSQRNELTELITKLWGKHTFISIFKQYQEGVNEDYLSKSVSKHFTDVLDEIDKIMIWTDEVKGPLKNNNSLLLNLDSGFIKEEQLPQLKKCEEVIYSYFSALYTDIKDVNYQIKERDGNLDYQLYIQKNVSGELTKIPFYLESNGTKNLLELLQAFFWVVKGNIVIVDEIDNGIHDILMNNIIRNIRESITGQLIFTTHDTILLRELPVSSAYFINLDSMGNKIILSGNDYEKKVLNNNNMQKMYLEGLFNAIPDPLDIDFKDIFNPLESSEV